MNPGLVKINDIVNIHNSYITLFARLKQPSGAYGIVFHDPMEKRIIQLFDSVFAGIFKEIVTDFTLGMTTGAIVGLARERTPADFWHSDTLERNLTDKNSLHQGIRRIIEQEDGIPVFINSINIIGNISPALAYCLKGNPTEIQRILNKYHRIQKQIINEITKGRPMPSERPVVSVYSTGEGYKTENRLHALRTRLDSLTTSSSLE